MVLKIPIPSSSLHTHSGDEFGTVIEGVLMVKIGDADWKARSAGQSFNVPNGTPMEIKNTGNQVTRVMSVLIIEKGLGCWRQQNRNGQLSKGCTRKLRKRRAVKDNLGIWRKYWGRPL